MTLTAKTKPDQTLILLTGATRGLGRAMVDEFAKQNIVLLGCGRSAAEISKLKNIHPKPHDFRTVDIASDAEVKSWASQLLSTYGPPDILLNNAGVINANAPLWQVTAEEFNNVVAVNLIGTANIIRHFLPAMLKRKAGIIINFSSGWGRSTSPEVAPYCATKWAIEGMTRALAQELPSGMAAVALNPGIINTDMLRSCFGQSAASYPTPTQWAATAVPFILNIKPRNNGQSLTAP